MHFVTSTTNHCNSQRNWRKILGNLYSLDAELNSLKSFLNSSEQRCISSIFWATYADREIPPMYRLRFFRSLATSSTTINFEYSWTVCWFLSCGRSANQNRVHHHLSKYSFFPDFELMIKKTNDKSFIILGLSNMTALRSATSTSLISRTAMSRANFTTKFMSINSGVVSSSNAFNRNMTFSKTRQFISRLKYWLKRTMAIWNAAETITPNLLSNAW